MSSAACSFVPERIKQKTTEHINDSKLEELAVSKGIVPKEVDEDFIRKQLEEENTAVIWIVLRRKDKLSLIEEIISIWKNDGITIKLAGEYYINEINSLLYESILNNDIDRNNLRGLGVMLKTIAVMEGDYDDGTDKLELLKSYLGEELFEKYKIMHPEKYRAIIEKQKSNLNN